MRFLATCLKMYAVYLDINFVPAGCATCVHSSTIVGIVFGAVAGLFGVAAAVFMVVRKYNILSSIKLPTVSFHNANSDRQKEARPAGSDETAVIHIK